MSLSPFHPIVARWFAETLGEPTAAQRRGCSARALILSSIEREVGVEFRPQRRVKAPVVPGKGEPVNPTHAQIYDVLFS